ncbi:hypothetical protein LWI29_018447 [Acer saccharum]|uniref:Uncharacterized protein n=1 Tax=Acer saccharum TaxID=4024 RepID=A0AA39SJ99_ACESA|nr:hypothetical protein LWI29_018447 [Acer saccharum]
MNNDSDKDGNSSGDLTVEPTAPTGDRAVTIWEQSAATPGTRAADPGVLQHFQTARPEDYGRKFTLQPLMLKQDNPLKRIPRTTVRISKGENKGRENV